MTRGLSHKTARGMTARGLSHKAARDMMTRGLSHKAARGKTTDSKAENTGSALRPIPDRAVACGQPAFRTRLPRTCIYSRSGAFRKPVCD